MNCVSRCEPDYLLLEAGVLVNHGLIRSMMVIPLKDRQLVPVYGLIYYKQKGICIGTRDCEKKEEKPHICPLDLVKGQSFCRCCYECEQECRDMLDE